MCRPSPTLLRYLCGVLLLAWPAESRAQPSLEGSFDPRDPAMKELARAAFTSSQATLDDLVRARVEAARMQLHERYRMYRAGMQAATLDLLLQAAAALLEAELASRPRPTAEERGAFLAAYWLLTLEAEQIVESKYRVGRVSLADYMQARQTRLSAEIRLRDANDGKTLPDPFLLPSVPLDGEKLFRGFNAREVARWAFAAGQADLRDLARARVEAARTRLRVLYEMYRAGTPEVPLHVLLEAAAAVPEAESAAPLKPAEQRESLAAYWRFKRMAEQMMEARYRVGRVSLAAFAQAQYERLDAEMRLRQANAGRPLDDPFLPLAEHFDPHGDFLEGKEAKELARSAFAAGSADLHELARAQREAATLELQDRYEKYRAGAQDATLEQFLKSARHLRDAEIAVHDDPAEQIAAPERYWRQTRIAEDIVQAKYRVGRVSRADVAQARLHRLDAEIRLHQARANAKKK